MDYIINPSWFYWINVLGVLHTTLSVIAVVSGIIFAIFAIILVVTLCEGDWDAEDDDCKLRAKMAKLFGIFFAAALTTVIFLPSTETLIEMQVAKFATVDNAKLTVDAVKGFVDYIVNAISSLK